MRTGPPFFCAFYRSTRELSDLLQHSINVPMNTIHSAHHRESEPFLLRVQRRTAHESSSCRRTAEQIADPFDVLQPRNGSLTEVPLEQEVGRVDFEVHSPLSTRRSGSARRSEHPETRRLTRSPEKTSGADSSLRRPDETRSRSRVGWTSERCCLRDANSGSRRGTNRDPVRREATLFRRTRRHLCRTGY